MADEPGGERKHVVEVELNQQQEVYLERVRQIGGYGTGDEEIIRNMFHEFLQHTRI